MAFWVAAILGGLIAGGVMLLTLMALAPFRGFGEVFTPLRLIAATVEGEHRAYHSSWPTYAVGLGMHAVLSIVCGLLFTTFMTVLHLTQLDILARMAVVGGSGLIYGNVLFGASRFFFLPLLDWPMAKRIPLMDFALAHVLFGAILGWFVTLIL